PAQRGKSTLFNALTRAGIAAENYPFCTIEPNVAGGVLGAASRPPGRRRFTPPGVNVRR
ncbi:hypothetical protein CTI14_56075, partial [Methylobacterium radiotolerans]